MAAVIARSVAGWLQGSCANTDQRSRCPGVEHTFDEAGCRGVTSRNADHSINLKFDFIPTGPNTTIQVREREPKDGEAESGDSAQPQQ